MSFCRWSDDDFRCDVYCYASEEGYAVHVANTRLVYKSPLPPPVELSDETLASGEWKRRYNAMKALYAAADRVAINHPDAGGTFCFGTAGECADYLAELKAEGLQVPQYAIDALREEDNSPAPSALPADDRRAENRDTTPGDAARGF